MGRHQYNEEYDEWASDPDDQLHRKRNKRKDFRDQRKQSIDRKTAGLNTRMTPYGDDE